MKRINIPTSGGLIWLSLNTKTDSSYWRSSCAGMLPWSLHLNGSLNVAAPGGIKEPELDITRCCFIPTCCETSEETFRRWGMILWHALPAHWISCKLRSVIGLNKTKTLITAIDALWENKMEQKKKKTYRNRFFFFFGMYYCRRTCWPFDPFSPSVGAVRRGGFYKETRPGVGFFFKVFACMSPICQGWRDTLTSCQVAAPSLGEEEVKPMWEKKKSRVCLPHD